MGKSNNSQVDSRSKKSSSREEGKKKKAKKEKKDKKGKKDKKEKKDKKKHHRKDKNDEKDQQAATHSSSSSSSRGTGSVVGRVGSLSLGADDFFSKADEYRVWLKLVRGTPFEKLSSSNDARQIFETEFCKAYNDNILADMFYTGIPLEIRSQMKSEHNWAIKISSKDEDALQKVADDIDRQTRATTW